MHLSFQCLGALPQFFVHPIPGLLESHLPARMADLAWAWFRAKVIAPVMKALITVSMAMLVMQMFEKLFMVGIAIYVKVFNRKPEKVYKWEPLVHDEESGDAAFPVVLVQIPMYNEKEVGPLHRHCLILHPPPHLDTAQVYQLSIGAACNLSWPKNRLIVQVLDDSDEAIKVDSLCHQPTTSSPVIDNAIPTTVHPSECASYCWPYRLDIKRARSQKRNYVERKDLRAQYPTH